MWVGRGVAVLAVLAVGCGGHQNSGQELPGSHPGASDTQISGESLLPGDPRVPSALKTTVTTRPGYLGIGKPSSPVPPARPPIVPR